MEFNTGCIMHLSERYALDVDSCYVNFLCKKTGAAVFQLDIDEFKELHRHEDEISKALLAVRYKEESEFSAMWGSCCLLIRLFSRVN